jgi:CRP-like cAMP-binding protein
MAVGSRGAVARTKQLQVVRAGERTNPAGKPVSNKILLSISDAEYLRIRPHLEFVNLPSHFSLHEPPEKLQFAYFLNRGVASIVVATQGGRDVEAGVVGHEGVVGTALAVGLNRSPLREVIQIEGDGFKIAARALQATLATTPDLQMRLSRYAVLQGMQVAQTAACNRLHEVAQRLARWLLMAQDRVDNGTLPITHDFLATMLGTDRPSVSLAAGELQQNKVIRYNRGSVQILNRKRLETLACGCYRVVQQLNGELGLK